MDMGARARRKALAFVGSEVIPFVIDDEGDGYMTIAGNRLHLIPDRFVFTRKGQDRREAGDLVWVDAKRALVALNANEAQDPG
jgi:hypothetical protein